MNDHSDAQFIFNTTPVGMYPDLEGTPIDISETSPFSELEGVFDAIYHPLRTDFVLKGAQRSIPSSGGLYMLAAQAFFASKLFLGEKDIGLDSMSEQDLRKLSEVYTSVKSDKQNIILIGMPSSGK